MTKKSSTEELLTEKQNAAKSRYQRQKEKQMRLAVEEWLSSENEIKNEHYADN